MYKSTRRHFSWRVRSVSTASFPRAVYNHSRRVGAVRQIIYADVLVFINTVVTYIILLAVKETVRADTGTGRLVTASLIGGLYSLIMLAPGMSAAAVIPVRILMGLSIILLAFRIGSARKMLRCSAVFLGMTFLFAGAAYFAASVIPGDFFRFRNGYGYADLSAPSLILITGVTYCTVRLIRRTCFSAKGNRVFPAEIRFGEKTVRVKALLDSGNFLTDMYTGRPVIIVARQAAAPLLTDEQLFELDHALAGRDFRAEGGLKLRLLPIRTLSGERLLPVFTADEAVIAAEDGKIKKERPGIAVSDAGFSGAEYTALINDAFFR